MTADARRTKACVLALSGLLPGCAEEIGRDPGTTTRVSGVVRQGDAPVPGGWIEFVPLDGTRGRMVSAPIGRDGRFVADGVAVGKNGVGLVGTPIPQRGIRHFFDTLITPVRRTIPPGASTTIDVDIIDEATRSSIGQAASGTRGR